MISEEQLQEELKKLDDTRYYRYNWCHQYGWLIREYIKLNKEADWLAKRFNLCPVDVIGIAGMCVGTPKDDEQCVKCWREAARRAVAE